MREILEHGGETSEVGTYLLYRSTYLQQMFFKSVLSVRPDGLRLQVFLKSIICSR